MRLYHVSVIFGCLIFLLTNINLNACTIFSGIDKNGQVWTGNNEDGFFTFYTYLNVYPSSCSGEYGYITYSYDSPENGANSNAQGGLNEAGLFFDFNALPKAYQVKNRAQKQDFPEGDHRIFHHIMSEMETVQQVVDFFEKYWFSMGFTSAQMHLADRFGHFAMIDANGSRILKNEKFQVSTNFSICGGEDSSTCERYPVATETLSTQAIGLASFTTACEKTAQRGWGPTIYSNIQNLNTGEITLFYALDYAHPYQTTITDLLSKGRQSYLMSDLFQKHYLPQLYHTFQTKGGTATYEQFAQLDISDQQKEDVLNNLLMSLVVSDAHLDVESLLKAFLTYDPIGYVFRITKSLQYYYKGDIEKAKQIVRKYEKDVPETSLDVERFIRLMEGKYEEDANVSIELQGYKNAQSVLVKGLGLPQLFFLQKSEKGWKGKFKLNPDFYYYSFIVDGKEVLSPDIPVKEFKPLFEENTRYLHRLCIGRTEEQYQRTIRVRVPNKNDEVFIAGNQRSLTNWMSLQQLKKVSDYEREITVNVHFPAHFKFTKGSWDTEAIMKEGDKELAPLVIDKNWDGTTFEVLKWKNQIE